MGFVGDIGGIQLQSQNVCLPVRPSVRLHVRLSVGDGVTYKRFMWGCDLELEATSGRRSGRLCPTT